jgi:hypothetical protein
MEVTSISRESDCVSCGIYPGALVVRSACDRADKAREGLRCTTFIVVHQPREARNLGGDEAQGGIRRESWLNPRPPVRDPRGEQSPGTA